MFGLSRRAAPTPADSSTWLVVGLGNPGPDYAGQSAQCRSDGARRARATAGREVLAPPDEHDARRGAAAPGGPKLMLAKPLSYMNISGGPVSRAAQYFSIPAERVIVLHDDLDLPFETIRLKSGGGHGGQNGVRDIIKALGTPDFLRVRIGIGRPPGPAERRRLRAARLPVRERARAARASSMRRPTRSSARRRGPARRPAAPPRPARLGAPRIGPPQPRSAQRQPARAYTSASESRAVDPGPVARPHAREALCATRASRPTSRSSRACASRSWPGCSRRRKGPQCLLASRRRAVRPRACARRFACVAAATRRCSTFPRGRPCRTSA